MLNRVLVSGALALAGCGGSDGTEGATTGEGSGTGVGTGTGGGDSGCSSNGDCGSTEICAVGVCREMWDRAYTITVVSATAAEADPNGDYWDALAGAPDLYTSVRVDGSSIGVTSTAQDTYSADWSEGFNTRLYASTTLSFRVFDEDPIATDGALDLSVPDLASAVRSGGGSYTSSSDAGITNFDFLIDPR